MLTPPRVGCSAPSPRSFWHERGQQHTRRAFTYPPVRVPFGAWQGPSNRPLLNGGYHQYPLFLVQENASSTHLLHRYFWSDPNAAEHPPGNVVGCPPTRHERLP